MSHLVLQPGTDIDCPLAENLEDIVRDVYVCRSMTQKFNSDLRLGNYEWEPCMEFMCIINRIPIIPVLIFVVVVLTIQQMFNE